MDEHSLLILPLDSAKADLATVGGKGTNLARLARAGFPVPPGFLVTTSAYRAFVAANRLEEKILSLVPPAVTNDPAALETASAQIRALFSTGTLPPDLSKELLDGYSRLGEGPVAVRSSATAEDLPELSFAGQQDTYLNVLGNDQLLKAVVDCWSSLWTARAIGYRSRNRLPHNEVALAVVIQHMVESYASGVLFTANPLTGLRSETVIDAALGLGEALVSGRVEPDHYVVDPAAGCILSKTLGAKALSIHRQAGGGTAEFEEDRRGQQALPDEAILKLARLGQNVAALYDFPQDIEWAWAQGQLYLLQSRPITTLFPLPEGLPPQPLKVFFSFGAVQGMLDPMTPVGQDAIRALFSFGASLFGIRVTSQTQTVIYSAGERLWVNLSTLLRNSVGRKAAPATLQLVEPSTRQAILQILDEPALQPGKSGISPHARLQLAGFFIPLAGNVILNLLFPRRRREAIVNNGERILRHFEDHAAALTGDRWQRLSQQADLIPVLYGARLRPAFIYFVSGVASGMACWNFLNILTAKIDGSLDGMSVRDLVLQVTRGMPFNPTTEMDLNLWQMAKVIRSDPGSLLAFQSTDPGELAQQYLAGELPETAQNEVAKFLKRYGGRGLGEIDLGRTRWAEDPTHIMEMVASFLRIEDESMAPDAVFSRSAVSAEEAIDRLAQAVRKTPRGWLKSPLVRFFAGRARQLMGMRESPKFFAVRMLFVVRRELLRIGEEFVRAGELEKADDLIYLTFPEIKAFAAREARDWQGLINGRRERFVREQRRRQIPRLLLSDGRAFYEGMHAAGNSSSAIHGSPVSPGSAEGLVRVVLDPRQANLKPGEILVCPGTDPSWTPLFLSAAGLVMEVGGMMTHGAVVAREYGIPAIVGVDQATTRLRTGQRILINGSSGEISMLDEDAPFSSAN